MKLHYEGEKGRAVCETGGPSTMTFAYRDVPFSDGSGVAKEILVGICDHCGRVVAIPPQSTPAIKAAREKAVVPIEAMLPAVYVEALDLACYRIDPTVAPDFRKRLLMYYVHRISGDQSAVRRIAKAMSKAGPEFREGERSSARRRLSLKVTEAMSRNVDHLMEATKLSKTELFKSLVLQIDKDIIEPKQPEDLNELRTLAAITSC